MRAVTVRCEDATDLYVGVVGEGPDVVILSGGPGCVNYLEDDGLAPRGMRAWFPEPRGVGRSGGGPHDLSQAIADLETIRAAMGVASWTVLGHSFGSDLAVRYALDHPDRVGAVTGVAGHGLHQDRTWSAIYEAARHTEDGVVIDWVRDVHESLKASFGEWIHEPGLFRRLADSVVPMTFIAAGEDIRPDWPLRQLAALVPRGRFRDVPGVPHNFWSTHPATWADVVSDACREAGRDAETAPTAAPRQMSSPRASARRSEDRGPAGE
ncbi:MAG: alpha/beta hydrolase [Mycobacterium sp.]